MIKIYSTPVCKYCKLAKEFFGANNIPFEETDISKDTEAKALIIEKTGSMKVPVIEVEGEFIPGFGEDYFRKKLGL